MTLFSLYTRHRTRSGTKLEPVRILGGDATSIWAPDAEAAIEKARNLGAIGVVVAIPAEQEKANVA